MMLTLSKIQYQNEFDAGHLAGRIIDNDASMDGKQMLLYIHLNVVNPKDTQKDNTRKCMTRT